MPGLTVITPTIGRPTLRDLVSSATGTNWESGDQWFIVMDSLRPADWLASYVRSLGHPFIWARKGDPLSCAGNSQRNHAMKRAREGNYFVFMDDNDLLAPGALNEIRKHLPDEPSPVQFDVTWMNSNRGLSDLDTFPMTHPNEHRTRMEDAGGGQQFVTPNLPGKVAWWLPDQGSSDYNFIRDTLLLWGGPHALKQVDYLIAYTA